MLADGSPRQTITAAMAATAAPWQVRYPVIPIAALRAVELCRSNLTPVASATGMMKAVPRSLMFQKTLGSPRHSSVTRVPLATPRIAWAQAEQCTQRDEDSRGGAAESRIWLREVVDLHRRIR